MLRRRTFIAQLLAAGLATAACGAPRSNGTDSSSAAAAVAKLVTADLTRIAPGDPTAAGAAVAGFGTTLLAALPADGNLVISPYSIYVALAMTRQGASGMVAAELDALLRSADAAAVVTAVDAAIEAAQPSKYGQNDRPVPVIAPANSLWVQDGAIQQPFLDRVGAGFGAGVYLTDYAGHLEDSRRAINDWVSERTKALIPQLIPEGALTDETVLTLVNALYFAAKWEMTLTDTGAPLPFTTASGTVLQVPTFGAVKPFATTAGDGWRAVSIPYSQSTTAMTLIVPDAGRFDAVQGALDADLLTEAVNGTSEVLDLTVPKFGVDSALSLQSALSALGATQLFEWTAWPELTSGGPTRVSDVLHQAVIDTDEKGTVAAAATGVVMESVSGVAGDMPEFSVDRPFFFLIHDTTTGAPLFLGRVLDPTA